MSTLEWPTGAWSVDLGDYHIHCVVEEKPHGAFTIVVEEGVTELHRETMTGNGVEAWACTEQIRRSFGAHITQKIREEWHRQGLI